MSTILSDRTHLETTSIALTLIEHAYILIEHVYNATNITEGVLHNVPLSYAIWNGYFLQVLYGPFRGSLFRVSSRTMEGCPSGLRRWFKAPVTSVARVRIPLLSLEGRVDIKTVEHDPFRPYPSGDDVDRTDTDLSLIHI